MKIFALQTDVNKVVGRFCHEGEEIKLMSYYHGFSFFFATIREIFITVVLFTAGIFAFIYGLPMSWVLPILLILWLVFVVFNVFKAYIDWTHDMLVVTTDKVILVDQTSIIKEEITPIHIENIGGISTFTLFLGIFPFGGIHIHLKEGKGGEDITLKYVPRHREVAATISDAVTIFQRMKKTQSTESGQNSINTYHGVHDGSVQMPHENQATPVSPTTEEG